MAEFSSKNGKLHIDGHEVIKGFESFTGRFWFATEKVEERKLPNGSMIDGKVVEDTIWFGFVQGLEEEWGNFSQAEIESLSPKTWEIPKKNLPFSGRRRVE
jgi:hypothetical protein